MTIAIRLVSLSPSADAMLQELAARERMDPDVLGSLVLELAIRERVEFERRFNEAAAKVLRA